MEKRRRDLHSRVVTLTLFSIAFALSACTKKDETAQVRLVMPGVAATSSKTAVGVTAQSALTASSSDFNSSINPTLGSQINCYAVFVGGGELSANSCGVGTSSASTAPLRFGPNVGFVPAGGAITIDTPPGQRVIHVVGLFAQTTTACAAYSNNASLDKANLSEPFLIASQAANIPAGVSSVSINPVLDVTKKLFNCSFAGGGGGGTSVAPYGDKREGTLTANSSGSTMSAGTTSLSNAGARSGTSALLDSKIFATSRRITNMQTTGANAGRLVTLGEAFTSDDFEPGDEVAWYVAGGASSLGSPDDLILGACGGGLFLGRYGTTKIKSVSGLQVELEKEIGAPAGVHVANLANGANEPNYCTIVLSRVSSFDQIIVPTSKNLTINVQPFNYGDGVGGFLMIRANSIEVATGSTLEIIATGRGFAGGGMAVYSGSGVNGASKNAAGANYNGGAGGFSSSIGGGGGGHGGAGAPGFGANAGYGLQGAPLNHCTGAPCLALKDQKAFFGGGGGGTGGSQLGGAGGGVILLLARTITGAGTLNVFAKGFDGATSGTVSAGGGAGGSIGIFNTASSITNFNVYATGGQGMSASPARGGGGGGGVINFERCASGFTTVNYVSNVGGGMGSTIGSPGVDNVDPRLALCGL